MFEELSKRTQDYLNLVAKKIKLIDFEKKEIINPEQYQIQSGFVYEGIRMNPHYPTNNNMSPDCVMGSIRQYRSKTSDRTLICFAEGDYDGNYEQVIFTFEKPPADKEIDAAFTLLEAVKHLKDEGENIICLEGLRGEKNFWLDSPELSYPLKDITELNNSDWLNKTTSSKSQFALNKKIQGINCHEYCEDDNLLTTEKMITYASYYLCISEDLLRLYNKEKMEEIPKEIFEAVTTINRQLYDLMAD